MLRSFTPQSWEFLTSDKKKQRKHSSGHNNSFRSFLWSDNNNNNKKNPWGFSGGVHVVSCFDSFSRAAVVFLTYSEFRLLGSEVQRTQLNVTKFILLHKKNLHMKTIYFCLDIVSFQLYLHNILKQAFSFVIPDLRFFVFFIWKLELNVN